MPDQLAQDLATALDSFSLAELIGEDSMRRSAVRRRSRRRSSGGSELQVVMFVARSLDNVRSTHPHYFDEAPEPGGDTAVFLPPRH